MHNHHIIPKHMGGSDEESNLILLSVEDHAEAHRLLYEKYGKHEDKVAWLSLSSQMDKEEIFLETSKIGGLNNRGIPKSEEHKKKVSDSIKAKFEEDPTYRERISDSMKGNVNSQNHKSDEYKKKQSEAMKLAWKKRKAKKDITS